jgi:uncharacterized Tic20 family protein
MTAKMPPKSLQKFSSLPSFRSTPEEKNLAVIMHLSPLLGVMFPLLGFLVPIGIWYYKKDSSPYLNARGKEVLNFMLSVSMASLISSLLVLIFVGYFMLLVIVIYMIVVSIRAAIQTSDGKDYRYPFILRLIQ